MAGPALAGPALAGLAGAGLLLGLTVHNVRGVRRARRHAVSLRRDHALDGTVHGPAAASDPLRLVTLGDSVMEGDGIQQSERTLPVCIAMSLAERTGRPVHLTQRGRSGARTHDVVDSQLHGLADLDPDIVVVSVGVNDGLGGRRLRAIRTDHLRVAEAVLAASGGARVVLVGAPDLRHAPALPSPVRHAVGVLTGRVGRRQARWLAHTPVQVVQIGTPTSDFGPDGFHPGPTATPVIAGWVVDMALGPVV